MREPWKTRRRAGLWRALAAVLCTLVMLFAFAGCSDGEDSPSHAKIDGLGEKTTGTWVVEMYVCGTDLESENGAASSDLAELTKNPPPDGVTFVIQTGGAKKWQNKEIKRKEIDRFVYDKDGLRKVEHKADADMAATDTFADFLHYANDNYAADHRILIVWDHGGGTVGGACYDERSGNMMSLNQMQDALASTYDKNTEKPPFDIVGFDCCLMATYGVANAFEGYGRYLVASQELEPGNGWYYTGIVDGFNKGVGSDPLVLAKVICNAYMEGCEEVGTEDEATLSVTDLSKLPQLRAAYEKMGDEAMRVAQADPKKFFSRYGRQAKKSENFGGNTRDTGFTNMIDLGDFAQRTEKLLPKTSKEVVAALDAAVVYKVSGDLKTESHGLSCYYPYQVEQQPAFEDVRAASDNYKKLYRYLATGKAPKGQTRSAMFDVSSMEDLALDADEGGTVFCKLTEQQMENLATIRCDLIWYDESQDALVMLGNDANVDMDWDSGMCKDNFDGTWVMLDKHPVYIDVTNETDSHITYAIPIKLNGEQMNLFVAFDIEAQAYKILGARAGLNEKGAADRNLVKLKAGDQVTTQLYGASINGNGEDVALIDAETFTLGDNPTVSDEPLGDGTYAYVFDFITPTGDYAMSDLASYELKNGEITTTVYE